VVGCGLVAILRTRIRLMDVERLQALLKLEKENNEGFSRLPRRFIETSKVLLDV
jgi:hypothetical protein